MSEKTEKIEIPESIQTICREFAAVAAKNNLWKFSGTFHASFEQGWGGEVNFYWEDGRHGEDSNELKITSTFHVYTHVRGNNQPKA